MTTNADTYNATRAERGWPLAAARGIISESDERGFRREVAFEPGHAWTTNYGRAFLRIRHLIHGPRGSVHFLWSTGVTPELVKDSRFHTDEWMHHAAYGLDVGYHADEPRYEDQGVYDCKYRPSGKCYCDGSRLAGYEFLRIFLTEGEDAMWAALEQRYVDWFEKEKP